MREAALTTNPDLDRSLSSIFIRRPVNSPGNACCTPRAARPSILGGEGTLGLAAACAASDGGWAIGYRRWITASTAEGFADFVTMYGGEPVLYSVDEKNPIYLAALENI